MLQKSCDYMHSDCCESGYWMLQVKCPIVWSVLYTFSEILLASKPCNRERQAMF